MIAACYIRVDFRFFQAIVERFGGNEVVDTPSRIVLTGFETITPPGINSFFVRVEVAPRIGKAGV